MLRIFQQIFKSQNVFVGAFVAFLGLVAPAVGVEPTTLFTWDFESEADVNAWKSNCLTPPKCENGALTATFTNWDPFVVSPQFELKPRPGQIVEIRMKSTGEASGELFYASSHEGPYNGFSQAKTASWDIFHDGKYHTYQIMPSWLDEPQIIKIRIDVGRPSQSEIDAGEGVAIDYVRIIDFNVENTEPIKTADWDATKIANLRVETSGDFAGWRSELFKLNADAGGDGFGSNLFFEWTDDGTGSSETPYPKATLRLLKANERGAIALEIPIPGGKAGRFLKNLDLSLFKLWNGEIYRWELLLPRGCELSRFAFAPTPTGDAAIDFQLIGPKRGISRANADGAEVEYEFLALNSGGKTLDKFDVALQSAGENAARLAEIVVSREAVDPLFGTNPTGDRLTFSAPDDSEIDKTPIAYVAENDFARVADFALAPGEAVRIIAKFKTDRAGKFDAALRLSTANANRELAVVTTKFTVLPAADAPDVDYVPEPRPVESDYEIGAYYFPGWSKRSGWEKVNATAPIRKPLLGWYDEADPEVVDWQIKWAAENGIQFFLVDWYWRQGKVSLEHWIKAFQRAKYKKYLKWAAMWANHTGPGTHSSEDMVAVTKYWIDNYFNTPEYYRIDGKPVVIIWDRSVVDNDMIAEAKKNGVELKPGEGTAKALAIARQTAVDAGFPGIYFIAMKWPERATDAGVVQALADETFDATTIYHFMDPGEAPR
ncbi:MAG: glycoside hydrolase family 99-like domain-containing protein, partial [Thermoguttaceae bacterium]|nr:glycoside hydrolase family 99-like domain-containing protein [Thermoguttaceae bacterium]